MNSASSQVCAFIEHMFSVPVIRIRSVLCFYQSFCKIEKQEKSVAAIVIFIFIILILSVVADYFVLWLQQPSAQSKNKFFNGGM